MLSIIQQKRNINNLPYYMYNIIQLNDKDLSELQVIAKELGIKKTDSLKKEDLVYKILDEQAIAGATKKVAADKLKEERKEEQKKKRSRIAPAKKDNKVVSATKEGEAEKAKEAAPAKPAVNIAAIIGEIGSVKGIGTTKLADIKAILKKHLGDSNG